MLAAAVDSGSSIPKEGETMPVDLPVTEGEAMPANLPAKEVEAMQPISLQTAPTKRSGFLIKKITEQPADTLKKVKPGK